MKNYFYNALVSVALVGSIGTPTAILTSNAKYEKSAFLEPLNQQITNTLTQGLKARVGSVLRQKNPYQSAPTSPETQKFLVFLRKCESGGNDDVVVLDSNNKYSYGAFQYQMATFKGMMRYYGIASDAEDKELENLIMDPTIQEDLTGRILEDGGHAHWTNCWNRYKKL